MSGVDPVINAGSYQVQANTNGNGARQEAGSGTGTPDFSTLNSQSTTLKHLL